MTIDAFIDTNVLLYAVSNSAKEIEKKWLARALLERKNFGLSAQVLQEFYVNATGNDGELDSPRSRGGVIGTAGAIHGARVTPGFGKHEVSDVR